LTVSGLLLFGQTVKLSREKQILLFHNIDSLINKYEFYSTLSEGNKISENQKEKFLSIFLNDTVTVFDDISPNYINNNEKTINEREKPVSVYVNDISFNYLNLYCRILETDAGTLYNKIMPYKDGLVVPVKIKKETQAFAKNGSGARYETTTLQDLIIRVKDTISCEPVISSIVKSGRSNWNYIAPFSRVSPWEKVLSFKGDLVSIKYGNQLSESILSEPKMGSRPGFGLEWEFRYLLSNHESYKIGLSFGLGASYLTSNYNTAEYLSANKTKDKDNEPYYEVMEIKKLNEDQSFIGFNLPVKLSYEKSFGPKSGFYFKLGGVGSYFMGSYKATSPAYTSVGYYPQYNVTLQDVPSLGFNKNKTFSGNGELPINPINVAGNVELGLFFNFHNRTVLYIGVNYNQYFLNLSSGEKSMALLSITKPDASQGPVYNSIMSEMDGMNMSMIGITIGFKRLHRAVGTQKNINYIKPLN
jgi:hypothetical protein